MTAHYAQSSHGALESIEDRVVAQRARGYGNTTTQRVIVYRRPASGTSVASSCTSLTILQ